MTEHLLVVQKHDKANAFYTVYSFSDMGRKTGDPCGGVIRLVQSFVLLEGNIEVMDDGFRFDLSCFKDLFYPPLDGLEMQ